MNQKKCIVIIILLKANEKKMYIRSDRHITMGLIMKYIYMEGVKIALNNVQFKVIKSWFKYIRAESLIIILGL